VRHSGNTGDSSQLSSITSGQGLGLYLSKQLAQFQQGDVKIKSEKGKGTQVFIYTAAELQGPHKSSRSNRPLQDFRKSTDVVKKREDSLIDEDCDNFSVHSLGV